MAGEMIGQIQIVDKTNMDNSMGTSQMAFFNTDGTARPVPTRAAAQADVAALTSAQISGGEDPTQAEYNQLQADVDALRTVVNSLLGKLRTAGVIASS